MKKLSIAVLFSTMLVLGSLSVGLAFTYENPPQGTAAPAYSGSAQSAPAVNVMPASEVKSQIEKLLKGATDLAKESKAVKDYIDKNQDALTAAKNRIESTDTALGDVTTALGGVEAATKDNTASITALNKSVGAVKDKLTWIIVMVILVGVAVVAYVNIRTVGIGHITQVINRLELKTNDLPEKIKKTLNPEAEVVSDEHQEHETT